MKELIERLLLGDSLNRKESKDVLDRITSGNISEEQIVAIIAALRTRTVSSNELYGFRDSLLNQAIGPKLVTKDAIDVCGTGGDGKDTFNISTLSSLVIAGAGYKVIKHGNYGVSSFCGSSTILENLDVKFTRDEAILNRQLENANLCFLHAPLFHPCLAKVGSIRKQLGIKTIFNYLGPLVNPVQPKFQLTGVSDLSISKQYDEILRNERTSYAIIHSSDGYDEISLTSSIKILSSEGERIVHPEELGFTYLKEIDLVGGKTIEQAKKDFIGILIGEGLEAQNNVVIANAAMGIQRFNTKKSFAQCAEEARESLLGGSAFKTLAKVVEISQN